MIGGGGGLSGTDPRSEAIEQLRILRRGTVSIISEEELLGKLERSLSEGRPLVVKLGVDPSRPDIHLGHSVPLRKLRQFQDLGHEAVLVIGDFTARIGDPSGASETRPMLSKEEVMANAETYTRQAKKILDPERTRIVFNGSWFEKMGFEKVLDLSSKYTVARMLERDDFSKRFREGRPITITEFIYPLLQGYDSVELGADVEIGGTDQLFNLLVGRDLQREYGQEPQVVMTLPLLVGLDGKEKMSKSLGNYVAVEDPPDEMFGKLMSIPDDIMLDYMRLLLDAADEEITEAEEGLRDGTIHPRDLKARIAERIVAMYHGEDSAKAAAERFDRIFRMGEIPKDVELITIPPEKAPEGIAEIEDILVAAGLVRSRSEAKRLILQGAIEVDGRKVENRSYTIDITKERTLRVGKKRFVRILRG
jgi:tyrosyl-tRNA synthetase